MTDTKSKYPGANKLMLETLSRVDTLESKTSEMDNQLQHYATKENIARAETRIYKVVVPTPQPTSPSFWQSSSTSPNMSKPAPK